MKSCYPARARSAKVGTGFAPGSRANSIVAHNLIGETGAHFAGLCAGQMQTTYRM
jgi:hypothetical protein